MEIEHIYIRRMLVKVQIHGIFPRDTMDLPYFDFTLRHRRRVDPLVKIVDPYSIEQTTPFIKIHI